MRLPVYSIILASSGFLIRNLAHEFLLISERALAGNQFKIFVKAGKIIKAAFKTKLFNTEIIFNQQLAGMSNPDLNKKLRIGFSGP
jgi:hypothetical protein